MGLGAIFIPVNCISFDLHFLFIENLFKMFQIFSLTFGIKHFIRLTFGYGTFKMVSPNMAQYVISTTQYM